MQPIKTEDQNALLKLEGGTEDNDLPCKVQGGWTISTWELNAEDLAAVLETRHVGVWLWWPNRIGVELKVVGNDRVHTDGSMIFSGIMRDEEEDDAPAQYSLLAPLTEPEMEILRAAGEENPARLELRVDMHPTCPVALNIVTAPAPSEEPAAETPPAE